ncbi:peptidase [Mytilinidion resinicola]|uniref:Peptide hydrolase n=1 Tax=Mytilinidion resinicola TaxID=574789 RepID=A0A6A6YSA1_9PEZI|nr:peptidase [Mytilinidion resinicola]KAF2810845.1 peptidase [Mytilinidion resinicola]
MRAVQYAAAIGALATLALSSPTPGGPGHHHPPPKQCKQCKHLPPVSSKHLQHDIKEAALLKGAKSLESFAYAHPERNRLMGGLGHNDTVAYLIKELTSLNDYYTVERQEWSSLVQISAEANLTINGTAYAPGIMEYSASGDVTALLVVVSNFGCEASDYPAAVSNNIALILRGSCEFGAKSVLAGLAGAAGAIIYNNIPGSLNGTLGLPRTEGPYIPTVSLSQEDGAALASSITSGATLLATLSVLTVIETAHTANVIATSNCGAPNTTLVLGAHTDSVAAGPGINDDGSGTIGLLAVAKALSHYRVANAVRFGFWSGEEEGLLGSTYYVDSLSDSELRNVRAYLNFDMIASPNYIYAVYDGDGSAFNQTGPAGSAEIEHFFEDYFDRNGPGSVPTAFDGRSDYQAFIDNGIPAGGTFTGAEEIKTAEEAGLFGGQAGMATDVNYHGPGDTVANLNMTAFVLNARAIAAAVAEYGTSFGGLPAKELVAKRGLGLRKRADRGVRERDVSKVMGKSFS